MGTYIKTFDQQTEYETYINSENALLPNMSYCRDNNRAYFNKKPGDPYNGHEYVDLGLPSGTLWAKCNVGANNETDYGMYFAWGETQGYTGITSSKQFSWDDYVYYQNEDMTKYNDNDGLVTLEASDDAASVAMGGEWHMPSTNQLRELTAYTNSEWTTLNGVSGYKFTSQSDNTKYIFVPAAGVCINSELDVVGEVGVVWSQSVYDGNVWKACFMGFESEGMGVSGDYRRNGFSVRGVLGESDYAPKAGSTK